MHPSRIEFTTFDQRGALLSALGPAASQVAFYLGAMYAELSRGMVATRTAVKDDLAGR